MTTSWRSMSGKSQTSLAQFRCAQTEEFRCPWWENYRRAGRTPLQLEQDIAGKLRNYIAEPEVTVMVQEIHSQKFNILGQVAKPGSYSLELATTVLDAIAAAGGFRDFANEKGIYILRRILAVVSRALPLITRRSSRVKTPQQNIKLSRATPSSCLERSLCLHEFA